MKKLWLPAAMASILLTTACGGGSNAAEEGDSIRLMSASFSVGHGLTLLAVDGGFFDRNGLEVELINGGGAANALAAVVSGSVDVYTGEPSAVYAASNQKEMLMPIRSYSGSAISLTLAKSVADKAGLTVDSPIEDRLRILDGLTIATVAAGGSTITLNRAAESVGATVENTYLEQASYVAALQSGKIDGFVGSPPFGQIAEAEGIGIDWIRGPLGEWPGNPDDYMQVGVGFTAELGRDKPDLAVKIIRGYLDAAEFIRTKPKEAKEILAPRFSELDPEIWDRVWTAATNAEVFSDPIPTLDALQFTYDAYVGSLDAATSPPKVDLQRMMATDLVERAQSLS